MLIGRVIGDVVTTQKHPSYEGLKVLLIQCLHLDGSNRGDAVIAVDSHVTSAGIGDLVLLATEGYSAFTSVGLGPSPIDFGVIGIIDRVELLPDMPPFPGTPPVQ